MSILVAILMLLLLSTQLFSLLAEEATKTSFPIIAMPGCDPSCGDVKIPYPFGITENCSLNENFLITCDSSEYDPPQPFWLSTINVTGISYEDGQMHILKRIVKTCDFPNDNTTYDDDMRIVLTLPDQFTINSTKNKFVAVGCDTSAFMQGYQGDTRFTTGCISFCDYAADVINGTCAGGGCCNTTIPENMSKLNLTVDTFHNHKYVKDFNPCSYAFVVEEGKFNFSLEVLNNLQNIEKLPLVLDWVVGNENESCANSSTICSQKNTICKNIGQKGYRCICKEGYQGNPYLVNGCQDINECKDSNYHHNCTHNCINTVGSYRCTCPKWYHGDGIKGKKGCSPLLKHAILVIGSIVGIVALVVGCCWSYIWMRKREELLKKEKNYEKNGGKILEEKQKESRLKNFTAQELKKATNNYHESTIIGEGGNGIVYKGYLKETKKEIAIKRSKIVDRDQIEPFINEVTILSRTNHTNVVELLGCCLEDEVPLLVYEFISNGTLYEHLHPKSVTNVLQWDARLRIAAETAKVISYLHSAASPPIIHRDVKTTNILLDADLKAKVADFGASRLVPSNASQIATVVQGTLGYLDPEYFQNGILTEKSDVYSFGIVLIELITGKVPISFERPEHERNLANLFLSSFKQNKLVEIIDPTISSQVRIEEVNEVAMLVKRCLNVKGEDRPTMEEVSIELGGLLRATNVTFHQDANVHSKEIEYMAGDQSEDALINFDSLMTTTTTFNVEVPMGDGGR